MCTFVARKIYVPQNAINRYVYTSLNEPEHPHGRPSNIEQSIMNNRPDAISDEIVAPSGNNP